MYSRQTQTGQKLEKTKMFLSILKSFERLSSITLSDTACGCLFLKLFSNFHNPLVLYRHQFSRCTQRLPNHKLLPSWQCPVTWWCLKCIIKNRRRTTIIHLKAYLGIVHLYFILFCILLIQKLQIFLKELKHLKRNYVWI